MVKTILGVDFGTSQTSVSVWLEDSNFPPEVIEINDGHGVVNKAIATALQVDNEGRLTEFGFRALAKEKEELCENVHYNFKPFLGDKEGYQQKTEQDKYDPDLLTFLFLNRLREVIEEHHFNGIKLAKIAKNQGLTCVFGYPAEWDNPRKDIFKAVAEKAGFPNVILCDEPIGIVYYSNLLGGLKLDRAQKILVYDFGGGTTDVAIATITKDKGQLEHAILAATGIDDLGGMNFDQAIASHYIIQNKYDLWSLSTQDRLHDQSIIERDAKRAKENLSDKDSVEITINRLKVTGGEKPQKLSLTRSEFETVCKHLIDKFDDPIYDALSYAGLSVDEVDSVILSGGSSAMHYVQERMSSIFPEEKILICSSIDALAQGLALYGRKEALGTKPLIFGSGAAEPEKTSTKRGDGAGHLEPQETIQKKKGHKGWVIAVAVIAVVFGFFYMYNNAAQERADLQSQLAQARSIAEQQSQEVAQLRSELKNRGIAVQSQNKNESNKSSSESHPVKGTLVGISTGASTGAIIGSFIPIVGTTIGAGIGAFVGGVAGYLAND